MSDPTIYAELADIEKRLKALERQEGGAISGTWSPTFTGSASAGTFTYAAQVGVYVRDRNVVTISGYIGVNTFTAAPTGDLRVASLPFTTLSTANAYQTLAISQPNRINLAANVVQFGLRLEPGATYGILIEAYDDLDVTVIQGNGIRAGSILIFGGSYIAEA